MENEEDYVRVGGDFVTESDAGYNDSSYGSDNALTAGTMELKGNFQQKRVQVGSYNYDASNFNATGTHKVIFSGKGTQSVSFESPSCSGFNDVETQNTDIEFTTEVRGWTMQRDAEFKNGIAKGTKGSLDLNGHTLEIQGNFVEGDGNVLIHKGSLKVTGDYRIQNVTGDGTYGQCSGYIRMENEEDYVRVGGDFVTESDAGYNDSSYGSDNALTAGTMELKGNFQQKRVQVGSYNYDASNFNATGTHTTILAGKSVQKVSFESSSSQFNNLKILGDLENDYKFTPEKCWRTLYINTDVKDVQITPQNTKVKQGKTEEFKATVIGINKPDQSVKWSVMGAQSEATSITTGGVLSVGADENAEAVIVKAVSVQDTSKYQTVTVDIVKNTVPTNTPVATIEPGKTALPDNTVVPSAAALPDNTVVPRATTLPDNTALPDETLFPEKTKFPKITQSPTESFMPNVTQMPEETTMPDKTEIPDITAMPSMTVEPPKTEKPVPTATVEHTTIPDVTQIPVTSQMPVSTEKANVTKQSDKNVSSVGSSMKDSSGVIYKVISSGEVEYQMQGDTQVDKIVIPENVTLKGDKYKVTAITNNAFKNCTKLKSIVIGKNVTKIGTKAFYNCKNLTKITIPSSIVKIGKQAFANCNKLKRIIIKTDQLTPKTVGAKAFAKTFRRPVVKVPKDKKKDYKKLLRSKGLSSGAVFR